MNDQHGGIPEDFDREISMLRESHPAIERFELDRAKVRARAMAGRPRRSAWNSFARSRAAVVAAITAGALMSSGATALGVSGLASSGGANIAQYNLTPPGNGTLPNSANGAPGNGTLPNSASGAPGNSHAVAPAQQQAQAGPSTKGGLPFTGLALIPVLLVGIALLVAGLGARRVAASMDEARRLR